MNFILIFTGLYTTFECATIVLNIKVYCTYSTKYQKLRDSHRLGLR